MVICCFAVGCTLMRGKDNIKYYDATLDLMPKYCIYKYW